MVVACNSSRFCRNCCISYQFQANRFNLQAHRQQVVSLIDVPTTQKVSSLKENLKLSIQNTNRGIFGTKAKKKDEIMNLVEQLELYNPLEKPARSLEQVSGEWILVWSTVAIQGGKRTKLGLREFVSIGEMYQQIDMEQQLATNKIEFNVRGMDILSGDFQIIAKYDVVDDKRVKVNFLNSTLRPAALQQILEQNHELLLSIFNPEGWLDITFVDDEMRIGRDDKGNVFILSRPTIA